MASCNGVVQDNLLIILYDSIILDLRSIYEDMHKYVFLRIGLGTYFQYEKTQSTAVYHVIYCCALCLCQHVKSILASITLER